MNSLSSILKSGLEFCEQHPISFPAIASFCVVVSGHLYYRSTFSHWKHQGVDGPKPWPVVGNLIQHLISPKRLERELQWLKDHGKVYGLYHGKKPILFIADPEIIRQVCIKDFDVFPNHQTLGGLVNEYQKFVLIMLQDDHWRRVRALMSPTFTSGKIKRMFRLLDGCVNDLILCFEEKLALEKGSDVKTAIVNIKDIYQLYTIDGIATCCYGLRLDRSRDGSTKKPGAGFRRDQFIKIVMNIFNFNPLRFVVLATVPKFLLEYFGFVILPKSTFDPLAQIVNKMIEDRKEKVERKFDDYLQILLNSEMGEQVELNEMDSKENHHAGLTGESILEDQKRMVADIEQRLGKSRGSIKLTDLEILSNAMFLLIVGVETTATLLTHISYVLSYNQNVQAKLRKEIASIAKRTDGSNNYSFEYDDITSCAYLDAVVSETLRFMPPVHTMDRVSVADYYIEKYNIHLPKGSQINLGFYSLMNDSDFWHEPRTFNPERFMPENRAKINPGSYCPFGMGPRHCIGMRFSLTETKLALAKLMMSFKLYPAPGTSYPPQLSFGVKNGIKNSKIKIVPLEEEQ